VHDDILQRRLPPRVAERQIEPVDNSPLRFDVVAGMPAIDAAFWNRCLPDDPEGHGYHLALEAAGRSAFTLSAAVVTAAGRPIAACPLFEVEYPLNTSLQGRLRRASDWFNGTFGIGGVRLFGVGSPFADTCAIAIDPDLDPAARAAAFAALLDGCRAEAASRRIGLVAIKDAPDTRLPDFVDMLAARRFSRIAGLPNTVVDVTFADVDGYLARLSRATRKDIRRKLKAAGDIRVERRTDISDVASEIHALHEATRAASNFDYGEFEALPPDYFDAVSRQLGPGAVFLLYWAGDTLAGFNLLLVSGDRAVDKFLGLRKDLAVAHNLYVVSWIENIRYCLEHGVSSLRMGPTAYGLKLRLGCRLEPTGIWFHHRGRIANGILRTLAPYAAFDRFDADLVAWRKRQADRSQADVDQDPS
jgi:hypothetical protein